MTLVSLKYGAFQRFESGPSSGKLVGRCDKHTVVVVINTLLVVVKQQSNVFAVSCSKTNTSDEGPRFESLI
jgi:hypothetical protein